MSIDSFQLGWIAHPIFSSDGNYPKVMITQIASNSIREGRSWSRLPTFSKQWINLIRGSADFFGLNYYTSRYVEMSKEATGLNPSYVNDVHLTATVKPEWKHSASAWFYSVPTGLGDILRFVMKAHPAQMRRVFIEEYCKGAASISSFENEIFSDSIELFDPIEIIIVKLGGSKKSTTIQKCL